ncbi:MAG: SUMF1/EgtB/PvdO family nonheme iron enzyme [Elusimicrobia bacterium]|nr:SUMF1/EgtB/PvdO family nonheme iron enzyme [Elusimicrobiota bacterium]
MPHIFISHVEEDQGVAIEIAAGLEAAGYAAWYYERDSLPGKSYLLQTGEAVEAASAVILIISPKSVLSNQVTKEVVRAHETGKPFIPVLHGISHAEFQKRQPEWREAVGSAASVQVPPDGARTILPRLLGGLRALDGGARREPAAPPPAAAPLPEAAPRRSWTLPALIVGALLVAAGSVALRLRKPAAVSRASAAPSAPPASPSVQMPPAGTTAVEWVRIPSGTFMMGSAAGGFGAQPVHRVDIPAFEMAKTEVTNAQYQACVAAGACTPAHVADGDCDVWEEGVSWRKENLPAKFLGPDQPVACVAWSQAKAYAEWVGGRLPSEAEWEYAARSAGQRGDVTGDCETAVTMASDRGCGRNSTWPACSKPAGNTAQGLCDMIGNLEEWVADDWHGSYEGAPADGRAWVGSPGSSHIARGGSWMYSGASLSSAARALYNGGEHKCFLGLRVARDAR